MKLASFLVSSFLMGQRSSKDLASTTTTPTTMSSHPTTSVGLAAGDAASNEPVFELKKKRPGCTGMFWRSDPTGTTRLASNDHWPRDGALLQGTVVEVDGKKWLLASQVKQKSDKDWKKAPAGAAMPFEYDNHYYLE